MNAEMLRLGELGLKLFGRVVIGIYTAIIVLVGGAFAVGTFFATTNSRLANIESAVLKMDSIVLESVNVRLRQLEAEIAVGVLPDAKRQFQERDRLYRDLERRMDVVERRDR